MSEQRWAEVYAAQTAAIERLRNKLCELEQQRDEFMSAFNEYGRHKQGCFANKLIGNADRCSCGFAEAIAKARQGGDV